MAWAAGEAAARRATLTLVAACPHRPALSQADQAHAAAWDVLRRAAGVVRRRHPEVPIETHVLEGAPEQVLRSAVAGADLLVVGADEQGPFLEAITGSLPGALLTTAPCPLVVVPSGALAVDAAAPVLVGVNGADTSRAALDYALAVASRSRRPLHVDQVCGGVHDAPQRGFELQAGGHREDRIEHFRQPVRAGTDLGRDGRPDWQMLRRSPTRRRGR